MRLLRVGGPLLILLPMRSAHHASSGKLPRRSAIVVGAGAFGLASVVELLDRGWAVKIVDAGPFPHPDAASNDISKIVRTDYGADEFYSELGERAIEGWLRWNSEWDWTPFLQEGFLVLAPSAMESGQFEYDSYQMAVSRGRNVGRLTDPGVRARYPLWSVDQYPDGFINLDGGWSPSGRVIRHLLALAKSCGAEYETAEVAHLESGPHGPVVHFKDGTTTTADAVVVAAGSWSSALLPELESRVQATGQPVFHFRVEDPPRYCAPHFGPWAAGTASTGWYGFPAIEGGILKISNHGPGRVLDPRGPREVHASWNERFAEFIARALPDLVGAPVVRRRLCVYTDTFDSDFLIDRVPDRPGVVVATGGSGHGFKFTPVLGGIIADAVEGIDNPAQRRFGWRDPVGWRIEPARFSGVEPT